MANRYWVGGTGSWNATTTNWSATSGGLGGASVPTLDDDVFFDSLSNLTAYTCTLATAPICRSVSVVGPAAGNVTIAGSAAWSVYGSFTLAATGVTWTNTSIITFRATTTGWTVTTNGVPLTGIYVFNGVGGGWTLGSNFTTSVSFQCLAGTFSTNNFNITIGVNFISSGALVRTINFGSSVVSVSGNFTASGSNLTTSGSGSISMVSASSKTFAGGGFSYPTLNQGGAGALVITGANTFANMTNTIQPATITFPASTTTRVSNFNLNGTAGNLITLISSTASTQATLNKIGNGVVNVEYLSIKDLNATPLSIWYAGTTSTDVSNNTGWNFNIPPIISDAEYTYALRSFTEHGRF